MGAVGPSPIRHAKSIAVRGRLGAFSPESRSGCRELSPVPRIVRPSALLPRLAVLALLAGTALLAGGPVVAGSSERAPAAASVEFKTAPIQVSGEIVDCSSYVLMGRRGVDQRALQAHNIETGMPACLIADDGQVYLLLSPAGLVKEKFQPIETYLGGGTTIEGTLYQRGALKAITPDRVSSTSVKLRHDTKKDVHPKKQDSQDQGGAGIVK
jgi:hypothetical protein